MYAINLFFEVGVHWFHRFSVFPINTSSHTLAWMQVFRYSYSPWLQIWTTLCKVKLNLVVQRTIRGFPGLLMKIFLYWLTSTRKGLMSRAFVVITVAKLAIYYFTWILKTKNKKVDRLVSKINNNHWIFRLKIWA